MSLDAWVLSSIYSLTMLSFFAFIVVHVMLVAMCRDDSLVRNMNHIVMGTDDQRKILLAGHAMCQRQAKNAGAASAKTSTLTVGTSLATAASFLIPLFV